MTVTEALQPTSIQALAGEHISTAVERALAHANEEGWPVQFVFNDVLVVVQPGETVDAVVARWTRDIEIAAEAYRNSPAGKKADLERADRLVKAQRGHDEAMALLPDRFYDAKSAILWLQSFAGHADHSSVVGTDFERVACVLEASGYIRNEGCGQPQSVYEQDHYILGRWIIGQAIDSLRHGLPPHPVLMHKFAPQYLRMVG